MKLSLKKQTLTSLSSSEMSKVNGGGQKRSNRKGGHCAYSYRHSDGHFVDSDGDGCLEFVLTHCQDK